MSQSDPATPYRSIETVWGPRIAEERRPVCDICAKIAPQLNSSNLTSRVIGSMVKNPVKNKDPIIWGALTGHIWKRIWKAKAFTM